MKINKLSPSINYYKERIKQFEQNYRKQRQTELEHAFLSPEYWQILNKIQPFFHRKAGFVKLKTGEKVPVDISIRRKTFADLDPKTIYTFKNGAEEVGYLELIERPNGAHIFKIENLNQEKYGGIGVLTDRIAVENCLKRGLADFEITGDAIWNSHAAHYLAGKRFLPIENSDRAKSLKERFGTSSPNKIIKYIIQNTPKGEKYYTESLKTVGFYLPKKLIKKYISLAETSPILK